MAKPAAAAGGGFSPTDITWAAMFWADELAGSDGDPVASWTDGSGNGRHATQATSGSRPVLRTAHASFNSQKVVEFDGTNDGLLTSSFDVAQPDTIVVVARVTNAASGPAIVDTLQDTGFRQLVQALNTSNYRMFAGAVANIAVFDANAHLLVTEWDGASSAFIKDGSSTSVNPGTQGLRALALGSTAGFGANMAGEIAFAAVKSGTLSAGEKSDLLAWAQSHYGTP